MELHEIRYFLALSETLNFTRAAEKCNVTQPALTRAIKSLEGQLGGPLIHRERGNTHLTELGRLMLPFFAATARQIEDARRTAADHARLETQTLRVGLMCTIGPGALVELFRGFSARHPGVEVILSDAGAPALEAALVQGDLDVAIACNPESPDPALHRLPLYSERFLVAFAPNHPLARFNAVPMRALDGLAYLGRANCEYDGTIEAIQTGMGVSVRECYRSERDDWIQSMAAAGLGVTLIPEFAVTLPVLSTRPLIDPEVVREVALVTVRGRPHSPAVGAFVHECRRYAWATRLSEATRPGAEAVATA